MPGAVEAPRGMLEFADPFEPYHLKALDPRNRTIVYFAAGDLSALALRTLHVLGYSNVAHFDGGFNAWVDDDRPVTEQG